MPDTMNVRRVAELAKIALTNEEERRLAGEMQKILTFARELLSPEAAELPPARHILPISNVFRPDEPQACLSREALLNAAPSREKDFISVPRTVE